MRKPTLTLAINTEEIARTLHACLISYRGEHGEQKYQLPVRDTLDPRLEGDLHLEPESLAMRYRNAMGLEIRMYNVSVKISGEWVVFQSETDHLYRRVALNYRGTVRTTIGDIEDIQRLQAKP